ncbi:conserved Plasmodium protein, unknown function [Plasmodium vivax]|uniref:(malaria parasite P. vivax) hypothetical protein n=1 Tax=Plasmodium vivax TaxID=5855 RepID=A0A1G4GVQ7_PLAVI|nr:unnamed protein product [Plasmodium vivax]SCO66674.1 conserved Plasmodium protein, unknown function [Plasmodium vivax]SCO72106.1 conserved Plasmodium protein, unknown function [Plasmodium vivax]VUZ94979.1 conserved Plasmodium protein, unknown function [Plasmodium vivax]
MKAICSTAYALRLLEFFPWTDDVFKLMYLSRSWRRVIFDVISSTNFLRGKKIMRLKNKKSILLILKYMRGGDPLGEQLPGMAASPGLPTSLNRVGQPPPENTSLCPFPNVLELIIGSCNPNPLFFNYIQKSFPRLMCFKLIITSPVCLPLLKNFCFNSKNLRCITICILNRQLVTDYREKLEKNLSNFFRQWGINVTLITELGG